MTGYIRGKDYRILFPIGRKENIHSVYKCFQKYTTKLNGYLCTAVETSLITDFTFSNFFVTFQIFILTRTCTIFTLKQNYAFCQVKIFAFSVVLYNIKYNQATIWDVSLFQFWTVLHLPQQIISVLIISCSLEFLFLMHILMPIFTQTKKPYYLGQN